MRALWALVAVVALAGCTDNESFSLSGSFSEERTQGDLDALGTLADEHGADIQIRESFPEQFTISGLDGDDCNDLRAILAQKAYLAEVGPCVDDGAGAGPY